MRTFALLFIAAAAIAQAPPSFQPVANVDQLMLDMIYPTSDRIFYVERDVPKNNQEWGALRVTALTLAESGNLLMIAPRARDQGNWIKYSKMMVDAGTAAYQAAQAKDLDGILAVNEALSTACIACHQDYRPGYRRRPLPGNGN